MSESADLIFSTLVIIIIILIITGAIATAIMCKKEKKWRNSTAVYPEQNQDIVQDVIRGQNIVLIDENTTSKGLFINPDYIQQIIK